MRASDDGQRAMGARIRETRLSFPNMSAPLASAFLGVSATEFERLEMGDARPTPEQLVLLSDLMDVEPGWFFRQLE